MCETPADALQAPPPAYADSRRGTLGRITDALEKHLLLDRIGARHAACASSMSAAATVCWRPG